MPITLVFSYFLGHYHLFNPVTLVLIDFSAAKGFYEKHQNLEGDTVQEQLEVRHPLYAFLHRESRGGGCGNCGAYSFIDPLSVAGQWPCENALV